MKELRTGALLCAIAIALTVNSRAQSPSDGKPLQIYFIDVEGGQSTLIVTPSGESLLVDTGYAGAGVWSGARSPADSTILSWPGDPLYSRDAQRILRAARDAGLSVIDDLLITHFHPDHDGGVSELAQLIPIHTFIDHGEAAPDLDQNPAPGSLAVFKWYDAARARGHHVVVKPGDRLPLQGLAAVVVSASGSTIERPLPGAGAMNPGCGPWRFQPDNNENPRSIGFRLEFGRFRFVQLGDLAGAPLFRLFCPIDLLGPTDVYQIPHHGGADGGANPGALGAVAPRVAVMNNGSIKGGSAETFTALHGMRSLEDVWQLHQSMNVGAQNFADDQIANVGQAHVNSPSSPSYWIKLAAQEDGSFVMTNARTGMSKKYAPR